MPLFMQTVSTTSRTQLIDITAEIQALVDRAKVTSGLAVVFVPHTTAGLTINENADPDVQHDLLKKLSALIPQHESYYRHNEGNSDAHLKSSLLSPSLTLIIENGRLLLGTWQAVYFAEFDGPRTRTCHIKLIPG